MAEITFLVTMLVDGLESAKGTLKANINANGNAFASWQSIASLNPALCAMALQITAMPSNRDSADKISAWYKAHAETINAASLGKSTKVDKVDTKALLRATLGGSTAPSAPSAPLMSAKADSIAKQYGLTGTQLANFARASNDLQANGKDTKDALRKIAVQAKATLA